jgi:hypothetical protein
MEKDNLSRWRYAPFLVNRGALFADGEEGPKGSRKALRHQVNIGGTVEIIPSSWGADLPAAPQDLNS